MVYLKFNTIFLIIIISFSSCSTSKEATWKVMKKVKFKEVFLEEIQGTYRVPIFGKKVSSLNGKEIQIKGYIIPIDVEQDYYVLSPKPYISSNYCGKNHFSETAFLEVQISGEHRKFEINEIIAFEGKLRLNSDDIYQLWYILEGAKVID